VDTTDEGADAVLEEDVREVAVEGAMEDEVGEAVDEVAERPCGANVRRRKQAKTARRIRRDDMAARMTEARRKVRRSPV
jgi:hypothetical protein